MSIKKYEPLNSLEIPRFAEIKTFMRLPNVRTTEGVDYAVVGVPFDTGVTYRPGQRFAPSAIREISSLIKPRQDVISMQLVETKYPLVSPVLM